MPRTKSVSLYDATRKLLRADKRTLVEIAQQSGVGFYWLRKISDGASKEPSVNQMQKLYEFLTGKHLV